MRYRTVHVHFVDEVDAAAQVEAERHGAKAQPTQPRRHTRGESGGDGELVRVGGFHGRLGPQLRRHIVQPDEQAPAFNIARFGGYPGLGKQCGVFRDAGFGEGGAVLAGQLQGRRLTIDIGQGN